MLLLALQGWPPLGAAPFMRLMPSLSDNPHALFHTASTRTSCMSWPAGIVANGSRRTLRQKTPFQRRARNLKPSRSITRVISRRRAYDFASTGVMDLVSTVKQHLKRGPGEKSVSRLALPPTCGPHILLNTRLHVRLLQAFHAVNRGSNPLGDASTLGLGKTLKQFLMQLPIFRAFGSHSGGSFHFHGLAFS
jgi:hypothetical protein